MDLTIQRPIFQTADLSEDCFRKRLCDRGEPAVAEVCRAGDSLEVSAFSSEPDAPLEETLAGLEQDDSYAMFASDDSGDFRLHRKNPGLRLLRVPWLYDVTCSPDFAAADSHRGRDAGLAPNSTTLWKPRAAGIAGFSWGEGTGRGSAI